jgi:hypothetical protein
LDNYRSPGSAIGKVVSKKEESYSSLDDFNFDNEPAPKKEPARPKQVEEETSSDDGDDLNDFLKGLDL